MITVLERMNIYHYETTLFDSGEVVVDTELKKWFASLAYNAFIAMQNIKESSTQLQAKLNLFKCCKQSLSNCKSCYQFALGISFK